MIDARVRGLQPATVEFVICHVCEIDNAICNYRTDLSVESSYFCIRAMLRQLELIRAKISTVGCLEGGTWNECGSDWLFSIDLIQS